MERETGLQQLAYWASLGPQLDCDCLLQHTDGTALGLSVQASLHSQDQHLKQQKQLQNFILKKNQAVAQEFET
jgi:hypothetical protein